MEDVDRCKANAFESEKRKRNETKQMLLSTFSSLSQDYSHAACHP